MMARHQKSRILLGFCFVLWTLFMDQVPSYASPGKATHPRPKSSTGKSRASLLRYRLRQCGADTICIRLLMEYGGMLAADTKQILLPSNNGFRSEAEVQRFQRRAGISTQIVDGVRIELQPAASKAFRVALDEARQRNDAPHLLI